MITRYQRGCVRCIFGAPQHRNMLCETCKANGWRWCCTGRHVRKLADMYRKECYDCRAAYARLSRGTLPPNGYITSAEVARRLMVCSRTVRVHIANGWMHGHVWQRCYRSPWYVRALEQYPPFVRQEVAQ